MVMMATEWINVGFLVTWVVMCIADELMVRGNRHVEPHP